LRRIKMIVKTILTTKEVKIAPLTRVRRRTRIRDRDQEIKVRLESMTILSETSTALLSRERP
jgi:hypothetical protein